MGTRTLMTAEEFAQMRTAEGEDFELVDGELIRLASAVPLHNKIRRRLERMMEDYFARNPVGELYDEIDCRLSGTGPPSSRRSITRNALPEDVIAPAGKTRLDGRLPCRRQVRKIGWPVA